MPEASIAKLKESAYLHWCGRGRPPCDDWADWFWAEQSQGAYFRWLNRGRPIGDELADWFAVLSENTRKSYAPSPNWWDAQDPAIGPIP